MQAFHLATIQFFYLFSTRPRRKLACSQPLVSGSSLIMLICLYCFLLHHLTSYLSMTIILLGYAQLLPRFSQKKKIKASYYTSLNLFQSMMHLQKSFCLWNCINCNNLKMYYFCRIKKRKLRVITYTGFKKFFSLLSPTVAISFHCLMNFITESS